MQRNGHIAHNNIFQSSVRFSCSPGAQGVLWDFCIDLLLTLLRFGSRVAGMCEKNNPFLYRHSSPLRDDPFRAARGDEFERVLQ